MNKIYHLSSIIYHLKKNVRSYLLDNTLSAGFTLIELLIVVVIIGVLTSLLTTNYITVRQRSRDGQRKANVRQMQSALELYRADQGQYKVQSSAPYQLNALFNCPTSSSFSNVAGTVYLQNIPCDPLGTVAFNGGDYYYYSDGTTYTLAACLENTGDANGTATFTTSLDGGVPACSTNFYYIVRNP